MSSEDTITKNDLDTDCAFCKAIEESGVVESLGSVVAIKDNYPVSEDTSSYYRKDIPSTISL